MIKALRMLVWMALLTGLGYPMLITAVSHIAFFKQSRGKLVMHEGTIVGSVLIAQPFSNPRYFWPRPSATDYNALPAQGSQLGPTSAMLKSLVEKRRAALKKGDQAIPSEFLYASGSGVDPHITLQGAYFQIDRIAQARGVPPERIKALIARHLVRPKFKFLGTKRVNVLMLNMALDKEIS